MTRFPVEVLTHMLTPKRAIRLALTGSLLLGVGVVAGCRSESGGIGARAEAREHVQLAIEAQNEGRYEDALRELQRAIAVNPTLTTAHLELGDVYRLTGDYVAAERSYRRAAELEPGNFDAQFNHGVSLQVLGRLVDAVRAYIVALQIEPYDADANLNLATAYLQLGEANSALPYARRAVAIEPQSGPARVNLGAILAGLDRNEEAIIEYQAAAERMDLTAPLLLNLADSLGKVGRYREMATTLTQLVEMEPSAQAYERLGFAEFRMNNYDEALVAFREAVIRDPSHYPALNGVGVCLLNDWLLSGQSNHEAYQEAINSLRRSVRINGSQPRVIDLLARYG